MARARPLAIGSMDLERLHRWLWRIVCSSSWEDDLYSRIIRGSLPRGATGEDLRRQLDRRGVYPPRTPRKQRKNSAASHPPGSTASRPAPPRTLMRWCRCCTKFIPGNCVGNGGNDGPICYECYYDRMPLPQMLRQPSGRRFCSPVRRGEAISAGLAMVRRSSRARFAFDDPSIRGGHIDAGGLIVDPCERVERAPEPLEIPA